MRPQRGRRARERVPGQPARRVAAPEGAQGRAGSSRAAAAGNRRIYQADPSGVAALRDQLDRFWNQALATFKEVVEQDTQEVS